jgi:hypothetical protein
VRCPPLDRIIGGADVVSAPVVWDGAEVSGKRLNIVGATGAYGALVVLVRLEDAKFDGEVGRHNELQEFGGQAEDVARLARDVYQGIMAQSRYSDFITQECRVSRWSRDPWNRGMP